MIGRIAAVAYVATVAALTAYAFSDAHEEHWGAEIAAAALALPATVPALLLVYPVGALAWNVTDASNGGPMWPVTLTFTVIMAAAACANVLFVRMLRRGRRGVRGSASASARTRSGA